MALSNYRTETFPPSISSGTVNFFILYTHIYAYNNCMCPYTKIGHKMEILYLVVAVNDLYEQQEWKNF
jgi:hypothetical protein